MAKPSVWLFPGATPARPVALDRWLSLKMQRLRRRLGLPQGVTPYGLRHRYGLMGIKNGVNLKLLSLCMGHLRTQQTEHYIAEAGLTQQVQQAAWQVAYGHEHPSSK